MNAEVVVASIDVDGGDEGEDIIIDPLLKYLHHPYPTDGYQAQATHFNVNEAIEAIKTKGYYHIPAVLSHEECDEAQDNIWDFVEDVSGGVVHRNDPLTWYPQHEISIGGNTVVQPQEPANDGGDLQNAPIICTDPNNEHDDLDPWPHTGEITIV